MKKIFISYSHKSRSQVVGLADDLTLLGYSAWFDKELIGGHKWWDVILENIRFCDVFIFTVTQDSISTLPCQQEFAYAQALNKPIIPILLDPNVNISLLDPSIQALQFVDYTTPSKEVLGKLNRALMSLPNTPPLPHPLPVPPEMPLTAVAEINQRIRKEHLSATEQDEILSAIQQLDSNPDRQLLMQRLQQHPDFALNIPPFIHTDTTTNNSTATLYIARKNHFGYSLRPFQVYLDGVKIGDVRNNETSSFPNIAIGKHELMLKVDLMKATIPFVITENESSIYFEVNLSLFLNKLVIEEIPHQTRF